MNILIIEDEKKVAKALKEGLERENFTAKIAYNGEDGFFLLNTEKFDLLILDLNLPGRDGIEILKTIRQKGVSTPVLILTARDSVESRVLGLETGADDYLVKPFAFPELIARIRVILRRGKSDQETLLMVGDLEMDLLTRKVIRGKQAVYLTSKEYDLLEYFLKNKNKIVSREMLSKDVWQDIGRATPLDNVIDVHITHLRKKLDDPFTVKLLHTLRGVGFMISEEQP
ncbi:MAG: response regulator transcription factor [Bacteroidota bacterium]|nr:response regulator transcription factor [Bacteroidota bacterium]